MFNGPFSNCFSLPVGAVGRQTGTPAADKVIWAARNTAGAGISWVLRRLRLLASFDGTAAATSAMYRICRFAAATPSGGTAVAAVKKRSEYPTVGTYDAREALAGLTVTSVTAEGAAFMLACQRQVSANAVLELDFSQHNQDPFIIKYNEGLLIALSAAGVVGDLLVGHIEFDEYTE